MLVETLLARRGGTKTRVRCCNSHPQAPGADPHLANSGPFLRTGWNVPSQPNRRKRAGNVHLHTACSCPIYVPCKAVASQSGGFFLYTRYSLSPSEYQNQG
jgi:hypothetical protein